MTLGSAHHLTNEDWLNAWHHVGDLISQREVDEAVDKMCDWMRKHLAGLGNVALGWSGGKDSTVLWWLADMCGYSRRFNVIASNLEFDTALEFYRGQTDLILVDFSDLTPEWVMQDPGERLFNRGRSRPYYEMTWAGQAAFQKEHDINVLLFGRRTIDGNSVKSPLYRRGDAWICNPLRDWSHELILGCMHYYALPLFPPHRDYWPNGWVNTSSRFVARGSWEEVMAIDPTIMNRPGVQELYRRTS